MSDRRTASTSVMLHRSLIIILLLSTAGCHSGNSKDNPDQSQLLHRIAQKVKPTQPAPPLPGKLAADGQDLIKTECAAESHSNASIGLIAGETGLHEDVFALRNRSSYQASTYTLDEALRLEALLHSEVNTPALPAEQSNCIKLFEQHLETLTDPLVQQDKELKEMDVSAFNDSRKEAEQQLEKSAQSPPQSPTH